MWYSVVRSVLTVLCLCVTVCFGKKGTANEFLVAESPPKKRTAVSMQSVGNTMASTLAGAAQCVEHLGKLQHKLIVLLGDMVNNSKKSIIGKYTHAERGQLRTQLQQLSRCIDTLNTAINHCVCNNFIVKK